MKLNETQWKVIYVASRREKKVAELLEKESVEYYLPLIDRVRVWSDRRKKVTIPLFSGYVFVKPLPAQRDFILTLPGVVKYLRYNNADAIVYNAEIDLLKRVILKGYDVSEYMGDENLVPGDSVNVTQGPFKNYKGEIYRQDSDHYMLVSFEQLGNSYKVKLPKQILKRIA